MKALKLAFVILAAGVASLQAQSTALTWQYNNIAALTILGPTGLSLAGAGTTADGDGFSVQLGYYSTATSSNPFSGTWTPIYGMGAPVTNTLFTTAGMGDGKGTSNATTDDRFAETGTVTLTNTLVMPLNGQIMSIRYYNNLYSSATYYGAAGNPNWLWVTPTVTPNSGMAFNIRDSGTLFFGSATAPQTNTALAPEPSSIAFALAGLGVLCLLQKRRLLA